MRKIITIILLFTSISVYANDGYKLTTIPPSPQTQLFENYLDNFSSYNINESGVESITIPLYEIKVGDISIPISLQYQTTGIRFRQQNGEIGVGWSISSGYRISRTMLGREDEVYDGLGVPENIQETIDLIAKPHTNDSKIKRDGYLGSFLKGGIPPNTPGDRDKRDGGYDIFRYNLPNNIGNFIIKDINTGVINSLTRSNERVSFSLSENENSITRRNINNFTLVNDDGYIYFFGNENDVKLDSDKNVLELTSSVVTAWPVKYIEAPNGEKVTFEYIEDKYGEFEWAPSIYTIRDASFSPGGQLRYSNASVNQVNTKRFDDKSFLIHEINTERERITFIRSDNPGFNNRLDKVVIYDKSGAQIKEICFKYIEHTIIKIEEDNAKKHYLLESVETYVHAKKEQAYSFKYNLPSTKWALAADQWGYYLYAGNIWRNFLHEEFMEKKYFGGDGNENYITEHLKSGEAKDGFVVTYLNRSENLEGDFFCLNQITFPTGGVVTYEYEPNLYKSFTLQEKPTKGGGIRLKRKTFFDSESDIGTNSSKTINYYYGINNDGIGQANFDINYKMFMSESGSYAVTKKGDRETDFVSIGEMTRQFSQTLMGNVNMATHFKVSYPEINVVEEGNGKTIYKYDLKNEITTRTLSSDIRTPPMLCGPEDGLHLKVQPFQSNSATSIYVDYYNFTKNNTTIQSVSQYDESNNLTHQKIFEYELTDAVKYEGMTVIPTGLSIGGYYWTEDQESQWSKFNPYMVGGDEAFYQTMGFQVHGGVNLLQSETEIIKSKEGELKTVKKYTYDSLHRLTSVSNTNSESGQKIEAYTYPNTNTELFKRNIITKPIRTQIKNNNQLVNTVETIYPETSIYPSRIETSTSNERNKVLEISYDKYDDRGNILQYTGKDGVTISYIWAYNNQYPIAEFRNMPHDEAKAVADSHLGVNITTQDITSAIEQKIRTLPTLSSVPKDVFITTYTYKPLVGMTSATDPSGKTIYYEYDNFSRLTRVKDKNDNILEEYEYNYITSEDWKVLVSSLSFDRSALLPNQERTYSINASGGSGEYTYSGRITGDGFNKEFTTQEVITSLPKAGIYNISCTVKDKSSGQESKSSDYIYCYDQILTFKNPSKKHDQFWANTYTGVNLTKATTVYFRATYRKNNSSPEESAFTTFNIAGNTFTMRESGAETFSVSMKEGYNNITISMQELNEEVQEMTTATLEILSSSDYGIGDIHYVDADYIEETLD